MVLDSPLRPRRGFASWLVISRSVSSSTRRRSFRSPETFVWQASRTSGPKRSGLAIARSRSFLSLQCSKPSRIHTRHVEQCARPPHAWACGTPARREASRIVSPSSMENWALSGRQAIFGIFEAPSGSIVISTRRTALVTNGQHWSPVGSRLIYPRAQQQRLSAGGKTGARENGQKRMAHSMCANTQPSDCSSVASSHRDWLPMNYEDHAPSRH
jgi:hypothetical protein